VIGSTENLARRTGVELGAFQNWQGVVKPPKLRLQDWFPVGPVQAVDTLKRAWLTLVLGFKLCVSSGRASEAADSERCSRKFASWAGNFRKFSYIVALSKAGTVGTRAVISRTAGQHFSSVLVQMHPETGNDATSKARNAGSARAISFDGA
jgi:hypothetical protein